MTRKEKIEALAKQLTEAQLAYETDVARRPRYHDGKPRKTWDQLSDIAKWSWGRPEILTDYSAEVLSHLQACAGAQREGRNHT